MSGSQNIKITTAPPLQGKGKVNLVLSDFEAQVWNKGQEVYLDKMLKCPCNSIDSGFLSSCRNCGGSGWVLIERIDTKMLLTSINKNTKFKEWSEEKVGTVNVTALSRNKLAFMDRIILRNATMIFNQTLKFKVDPNTGDMFAFTIYPIIFVEFIFIFESTELPLRRLSIDLDYTVVRNKITIISEELKAIENLTISIRYTHRPQYHIIDLNRELMNSEIDERKILETGEFPVSAIARLSHYVLDIEDFNGTYYIDNSQPPDPNCSAVEPIIDPETGQQGYTYNHQNFSNRDAENAHPILSITGLIEALAAKLEGPVKTINGESIFGEGDIVTAVTYDKLVDYREETYTLFLGLAPEGSAEDDAVWIITKIVSNEIGEVVDMIQVENYKWTERELL